MSNNFTPKAENALNRAVKIAEELGHTYIGTEHVLLALADDESCCASILLRKSKLTKETLLSIIRDYSGFGSISSLNSKDTTPKCRKILEASYKIAKKYSAERIGTEHLLLSLLEEKDCVAFKVIAKTETDIISLRDNVVTFLRSTDASVLYSTEPVPEVSIPNLIKYGKNLSLMASRGELDPVIGRDKETDRLIRVLSRRSKNNPCLIGEAGVGKTAIVEGLAIRIAEGKVPTSLMNKIVFSLDLTSMVAGAKYRGDFEERIKSAMLEAKKNKAVILFIDEIHTIVGAGSAEGAIDAANILKPELSRGEIQLIGATTLSEYRKFIEKDSALERRFQPIIVEEPSIEGTINILKGIRSRYEFHHRIKISDEAIEMAAKLSERYIQDRFLPDKAIDVLDEACALASAKTLVDNDKSRNIKDRLRQTTENKRIAINSRDFEKAKKLKELEMIYASELNDEMNRITPVGKDIVTDDDVFNVINEITGINPRQKSGYDKNYFKNQLSQYIIGQDEAVDTLSKSIVRSFAGINSPHKPRGIFLFLGESGVGKTELAKALSFELFHNNDALIRYDMSEFSEGSAVSKFIGSAPGYIGFDEQNSALEKIRKHPYSVILLDEIDKAHPDVLSLLLQIFDTGSITDSSGRKINFRNTYIIMTSNVGAGKLKDNGLGFMRNSDSSSLREKIKPYFRDEFINRIDDIILFSHLDSSALKQIAKNKINELSNRISLCGIKLIFDEYVYDYIASKSGSKGFGARALDRIVVCLIENPIADMMVNNEVSYGDTIKINIADDKVKFDKTCLLLN